MSANYIPAYMKSGNASPTAIRRTIDSSRSIMQKTNWTGPAYPVRNLQHGHYTTRNLRDLLNSSVFVILTTQIGSRPMRRTFGSWLPSMVFEPNDDTLQATVKMYTIAALRKWEPRVEVIKTDTSSVEHFLGLTVYYKILATKESVSQYVSFANETPLVADLM